MSQADANYDCCQHLAFPVILRLQCQDAARENSPDLYREMGQDGQSGDDMGRRGALLMGGWSQWIFLAAKVLEITGFLAVILIYWQNFISDF